MRILPFVLIFALTAGALDAAQTKTKKSSSPPTARPDTTLVTPDLAPPPPTFAAPTRTVEMEPIGAVGSKPVDARAPTPPPAPPAAAPQAEVVVHAEVCLRAEAPRAAKAESSAKLAVDLLLMDLCAGPVDRASTYAHNVDVLARFTPQSERAAAGLGGAKVDPTTGEIVNPPAGDVTGALTASGLDRRTFEIPPQLRKFAAELILQAKNDAARPAKAH